MSEKKGKRFTNDDDDDGQKEIKFEMKTNLRSGLQYVCTCVLNEMKRIRYSCVLFFFLRSSRLYFVQFAASVSLCPRFRISVTLDWQTQQHNLLDCGYKMLLLRLLLLLPQYVWVWFFRIWVCVCVLSLSMSYLRISLDKFIHYAGAAHNDCKFHWIFCVVSLANESARNRKRKRL